MNTIAVDEFEGVVLDGEPEFIGSAGEGNAVDAVLSYYRQSITLRDAASSGNLTELQRLVQEGVPVNDRSSFNNTALLYAAMHGNHDCLRFLIANGADVNVANGSGYTPLICAAKIGDAEAVEMLLEAGAETWHTLKNEDGSPRKTPQTALTLAERNGHHRVAELLEGVGAMQLA